MQPLAIVMDSSNKGQDHYESSYHLYVVQIDLKKIRKTRSEVMNILKEVGVGTQVHYIPIIDQPYYKSM